MIVVRVLIDNGSTLNICLMATLKHLMVDMSLILPSTMIIKAFNSTCHQVQGEIELMIKIGPRSFMVNFQVIKVDSPYNMLLEALVAYSICSHVYPPSETQVHLRELVDHHHV